ncbi:lasso peptide biosynthesis B2 protein [Streptomyces varsoviensis]|uniref:lasso peptide biosynthesis B2 protein n=1 Tax=Streptomyces varsoviensis TaxID=67373 RepID=UPI0033E88D77
MSPVLDTTPGRPPLGRRLAARIAVGLARLLAHLPPRRLRAILRAARWGATPADYATALRARQDVTAVSVLCSGRYCLQRSLATALLCRLGGVWPTWCTGVRTPPFAAHAWVEADGLRVGEPEEAATYRTLLAVPPASRSEGSSPSGLSRPPGLDRSASLARSADLSRSPGKGGQDGPPHPASPPRPPHSTRSARSTRSTRRGRRGRFRRGSPEGPSS